MAEPQRAQVAPRANGQPPPTVEAPKAPTGGSQLSEAEKAELVEVAAAEPTLSLTEVQALMAAQDAKFEAQLAQVRAEALQQAGAVRQPGKLVRGADKKHEGDIRVRALRDINGIRMGAGAIGRIYQCPAQDDLWMNKSHAIELSTGPHHKEPYVLIK